MIACVGSGTQAMKLFFGIAIFVWLLCGLAGAFMMNDLDSDHWQTLAKGPITLIKAIKDAPTPYPGQA